MDTDQPEAQQGEPYIDFNTVMSTVNVNKGLPPLPPQTAANKTAGAGAPGHLRLGKLSRFLLEKAQSNDSGLDLSPGTLQTLVHPLRSSNSSTGGNSTSSLHVRTLFESPASSDDTTSSPHSNNKEDAKTDSFELAPPMTPSVSRSALSEQSHNSETTIIEKTLTDDSKNVSKSDCVVDRSVDKSSILKESTNPIRSTKVIDRQLTFPDMYKATPKDKGRHVPQSLTKSSSISNLENKEPGDQTPAARARVNSGGQNSSQTYHFNRPSQNNSNNGFLSHTDIAAVIPPSVTHSVTSEHGRRAGAVQHTPKLKSCKKKPPVPTSNFKKQTGWKFLSEHVQGKEFLILEQLGKGGCGEVSLVMEKDTRKQFALKIVQLRGIDEAMVQECINEVEMLIDLKGTELVVDIQSWEFNRAEKTMKILMEKGQCDLNYTIYKSIKADRPIKLLKIKYIFESLLVIIDKIHSKDIVHADLKPANFVWVDDNLKIIDFGIASRLQNDLTSIAMANPKGTLNFISPEIIKLDDMGHSRLSPKSDIWAVGCILYLMVYGKTPFDHIAHPVTKMNAIVQGDIIYHSLPPHLQGCEVLSVLKLCFQIDYKRRPTAADLLMHPFLKS